MSISASISRYHTKDLQKIQWSYLYTRPARLASPHNTIYPFKANLFLKSRDIASEKERDGPVHGHHDLVPYAHALGQVRRPPEEPGRPARQLVRAALVDRPPAAQIGHDAPVPEAEGPRVRVRGPLVQLLREVGGLLARDLCRRGVSLAGDDRAVADAVDVRQDANVLSSTRFARFPRRRVRHGCDAEAGISHEPARLLIVLQPHHRALGRVREGFPRLRLRLRDLGRREFLDQRVLHEPRAPDHDAGADLLVAVLLELQPQAAGAVVVGPDAREVVLRLDGDALAPEHVHGVLRQLLVEHGQHLGRDVVHGDVDEVGERRVDPAQVVADEVVQLGGELDARRPAAHDGEVEQLPPLLVRRDGQRRLLEALQDLHPDLAGVPDVAEEVGVLLHPLDAERLRVRADGDDELVVRHVERGALLRLLRFFARRNLR